MTKRKPYPEDEPLFGNFMNFGNTQPSHSRKGREPGLGEEYYNTIQNMYNIYKGTKQSPLVKYIARKIRERKRKSVIEKTSLQVHTIELGRSRVQFLKPTKQELAEIMQQGRLSSVPH